MKMLLKLLSKPFQNKKKANPLKDDNNPYLIL